MFPNNRPTRTGRTLAPFVFALQLTMISGCSPTVDQEQVGTASPLEVSPDSYDFSHNPGLLERIVASPHGYFRFVNREFSQALCERFKKEMTLIPTVNLHGDAHLEQYTVTEVGRGLVDFDDSSLGPVVLDWVRFAASACLACREHGWQQQQDEIIGEFLKGYRAALENPKLEPTPPPLVERIRSTFTTSRTEALARAEAYMSPLEPWEEEMLSAAARDQYKTRMLASYPALPETFFDIKSIGRLRMGLGSALDLKFLMRVEGPTDAPEDDVILEAKEVRDLSMIECIQPTRGADAFRLLAAQARIAYEPYPYVGYEVIHPRKGDEREITLWIHAWFDNYKELAILDDLETVEDLETVAYDVGVQLGLGHPREIADPHIKELRYALLECLEEFEDDLLRVTHEMMESTIAAWEKFRVEAQRGSEE